MYLNLIACFCLASASPTQENTDATAQEYQLSHSPEVAVGNRPKELAGSNDSKALRQGGKMMLFQAYLRALVLVALAIISLIVARKEYARLHTKRRLDRFLEMRKRYSEDPTIRTVCAALASGDPGQVRELEYFQKRYFLGLFEEIAILLHTGVLDKTVTLYMFGYFAILCWDNDVFWGSHTEETTGTIHRDSKMWLLFRNFAEEMTRLARTSDYDPRRFDFRRQLPFTKRP